MHNVNTGPLILEPGVNCEAFAMIGSQVIPGAAHEGSDHDIAILLVEGADREDMFDLIVTASEAHKEGNDCLISDSEGYECDGDGMTSCKIYRGETVWNYLVFTSEEYFYKFVDATTVARQFGITDKPTRVELFRMICDGYRSKGELRKLQHITIHEAPKDEGVPF